MSLPMPVRATKGSEPMQLEPMPNSGVAPRTFNARALDWATARAQLGTALRDYQSQLYLARHDMTPAIAEQLYTHLTSIVSADLADVARRWHWLADYANGNAGSLRYHNEFVPEWHVLSHEPLLVVYCKWPSSSTIVHTASAGNVTSPPSTKDALCVQSHRDPAWVFETVCIEYLRYACAQQLALLACIASRFDDAMVHARSALSINVALCERTLPQYFATLDGKTASHLLAAHYHGEFMQRHLRVMGDQLSAVWCCMNSTPHTNLLGAALQLRVCANLQRCTQTLYDERAGEARANYEPAVAYARCLAHYMLAYFFWLCFDDGDAVSTPRVITAPPGASLDSRALLINALYCARSALLQSPNAPAQVAEAHERVGTTLKRMYSVVLPPVPVPGEAASRDANETVQTRACISDDIECDEVELVHAPSTFVDLAVQKTFVLRVRPPTLLLPPPRIEQNAK